MSILTVRNVNKRFGGLKALDEVNLEVDLVAKYVERLLLPAGSEGGLSMEFLKRHGIK